MRTARILLTLVIAMVMTAPLSAQQNQKKKGAAGQLSAPARALARIDKLHKSMEGMELNDEQTAAVAKIHEEIGPQMKKALDTLKEILTPEQQEAVEQAVKTAKDAGKEGWAFFRAVDMAVKPTDAQKEKMDKVGKELDTLQKDVTKKIMAVLTAEQKETLKKKMAARQRPGAGKRGKKKNG